MNLPSDRPTAECEAPQAARDPLKDLEAVLGAIRKSSFQYARASIDSVRLRIEQVVLRAFVLLAAAVFLIVLVVAAAVLTLIGAAQAVADGLERPLWTGLLAVGIGSILAVLLSVRVAMVFNERRRLERIKARIAERSATQERA
jgi:hypothetical protein